jgi:hypothetical protein
MTAALDGTALVLSQPGASDTVLDAIGAGAWGLSETVAVDGCFAEVAQVWAFDAVGATTFSATFEAMAEAYGACDLPQRQCTVRYAVHGIR